MRSFFRVVILLFLTVAAKAESFNFTFTGDNFSASGTLLGSPVGPGVYHLYGATGTVTDLGAYPVLDILGLYPDSEINGADNLLFTSVPYVDSFGFNFALTDGSSLALAHDNLGYFITGCYQACSPNSNVFSRGDLVVSSTVPEPSSLLLFTTGLLICALPLRKHLLN